MKPSFAYVQRIQERLPPLAQQQAEHHLACLVSGEPHAEPPPPPPPPGGGAGGAGGGAGAGAAATDGGGGAAEGASAGGGAVFEAADGRRVAPAAEARRPTFTRVEEVKAELEGAKLHDRGVVVLPVWAVEYSVLRQPARAFVSALRPGPDPSVAGVTHYGGHALRFLMPATLTAGVAGGALAAGGGGGALAGALAVGAAAGGGGGGAVAAGALAGSALGGAGTMLSGYALAWYRRYRWREQGELRKSEQLHNQEWKVRRYWIAEVERVLDWQEPQRPRGAGMWRLNGDSDDYKLLGLPARDCQRPPPTPAELKAAFRAKSLKWHPDRNLGLPAEQQAECVARFQKLLEAHDRLLKKHGR
eukprot:Transcript_10451.p1 GENE.Transcript_10451~~Transcript_10451.p1  ORF type:complete len:360 (-),score=120.48 Transcript_10451:99-1178(-)